ncbi:MAG: hypothetical protein EOL97_10070 [Spirochaetia bacterium]|nr:hypothetical protein [Spirochaetia bacterium]
MSQIPVSQTTYSKLNILKTKAIVFNKGKSITWDTIIDTLIESANKNENDFLNNTNGKRK